MSAQAKPELTLTYLKSLLVDEQGRKDLLAEMQERQARNEKQTVLIERLSAELSRELAEREDYGRAARHAARDAIAYAERAAVLLEESARPCVWRFGADDNAPDCWVSGCGGYLSAMDEILPNWDAPKPVYCPACGHPIWPDRDDVLAYEQWQSKPGRSTMSDWNYKPRARRAAPSPATAAQGQAGEEVTP